MKTRLSALQKNLQSNQALLLSRGTDLTYFTGFEILQPTEREAVLFITDDDAQLLHGAFSPVPPLNGFRTIKGVHSSDLLQVVETFLSAAQNGHQDRNSGKSQQQFVLYYDPSSLTAGEYTALAKLDALKLEPLNQSWLWQLRSRKTKPELEKMRAAARASAIAFGALKESLKQGMTEREVALELENELRAAGATGLAFPTIVAFGDHAALPHHQPTERRLEKEMPVLIDFGGSVNGYASDMTRTFWFGDETSEKFLAVEAVIQNAYSDALAMARQASEKQITAQMIDQAARKIIADAGYGQYFIHTTGHGLGLDIHEQPSLNSRNETQIEPSMVLTIEPGIYLEGEFGYRHENTILITAAGAEELTA